MFTRPPLPRLILPLGLSLLAACSGGGGGGSSTATPTPAAASITSFSASPATVDAGGSATLSWAVRNAQACRLNGQAVDAAGGSQATGALQTATEFTLSCNAPGGNDSRRLSIAVNAAPPPAAVNITRFSAEPAEVAAGASSALSWAVQNATSCSLNGANESATEGSRNTGPLQATTRYLLSCRNAGSQQSRELEVKVTPVTPPAGAGWQRLADMPDGIAKLGVAALGNTVYVVGGYNTSARVLHYDIAGDSWSQGASLLRGTDNVAALSTGSAIYAVGGEARLSLQTLGSDGVWRLEPALPSPRFASSAGFINGKLHMVAGWNYNNRASASLADHDRYDPATRSYTRMAPIPTARNGAAAGVIGSKLYVAGGRAPGIRASDAFSIAGLEIYDAGSDSWTSGPAMPTARGSTAGAVLNGKLYVFGGETVYPAVSNAVERYDPATNRWESLPPMPYSAHGLGAVAVGNAIYVMGGFTQGSDAEGSESKVLYRYVPEN